MDTLEPSPMPASAVAGSSPAPRPVVLVILDGFGCRDDAPDNAITRADAQNWRRLLATCPHTTIDASELRVGLPEGQMGNSEVGHLNIGAGRVVYQDYTRIDVAIRDGEFARNDALVDAVETARAGAATLHVLGLLSPGGVHSHERQIAAMVDLAGGAGVRVAVHAFLDGRDTPPRSALPSLQAMDRVCARHHDARIASICGRYYAMDRDQRWERIAPAYELIVDGVAPFEAATAEAALAAAYARDESDEFVQPTVIAGARGATQMRDGDVVVFMNFRADRARQMTRALTQKDFSEFARDHRLDLAAYATMSEYDATFGLPVAFPPRDLKNILGETVSRNNIPQLRIAETEKYAHVTYFFNGGEEKKFPLEERILIPSVRDVPTYDLKPEMSAYDIAGALVPEIEAERYGLVVLNYANADMVGHTGKLAETIVAVECLDACLGRLAEAVLARGGALLMTGDHGNAEQMIDPVTGEPHTAHTTNPVPLIVAAAGASGFSLAPGGSLRDVAPTILGIQGLETPREMTGRDLRIFSG